MNSNFPIVCIGGSAGGLISYVEFLKSIPPDIGIAIVIVNHITRQPSTLDRYLTKYTSMPVRLIEEGSIVTPDHVFIIPHNRDLHILDGAFRLKQVTKPNGWPNVISIFLSSLAQHWGGTTIAVIVSGLDSDGADALGKIKNSGGITMAQIPNSAEWSDMPDAAIKSGNVDYILSIEDIVAKIVSVVGRPADAE